jgi:SAM-dependent methyltransferase
MMFDEISSREYKAVNGIAYYVPEEEQEKNIEYAREIIDGHWVDIHWRDYYGYPLEPRVDAAKHINEHGGTIFEICTGPGGGYMPWILHGNRNAELIISDLCPTVVKEWKRVLDKEDFPKLNYAALDMCDLPFKDETLDVISGCGAIINIEGDRFKALSEIYRVLKPGGLLAADFIYVSPEYAKKLPESAYLTIKQKSPTVFVDFYQEMLDAGFTKIEDISGGIWSNENDNSVLATLCRNLGVHLEFTTFMRYCWK